MTTNREPGTFFPTEDDAAVLNIFADILKTDRRFEDFSIVEFCNAIDQMGRRYSASDAALPSSALDQIVDQHRDQLVRIYEFGAFVQDAEPIRIAVGCQTQF